MCGPIFDERPAREQRAEAQENQAYQASRGYQVPATEKTYPLAEMKPGVYVLASGGGLLIRT